MESKTAIGNDKTKKLCKLKKRTFKAKNRGKPNSTIFLIRSNITPTDNEITVKAEIANTIGGIICPNNHLSIKGIEYQGLISLFIIFINSDWFKDFKRSLFNLYFLSQIIKYQWWRNQYKILAISNFLYY